MSVQVCLNLVNEFGKRDKMRGLLSIFIAFRNGFDKFNNTGARILDSIYFIKVVRDPCQKITLLLLKSKSVRVIVPESCF